VKGNSSKDQTVLEKSLEEPEFINIEDEAKNVLVTIIHLVINSGEAKAMVRHLWKAVELREQHYKKLNGNQPIKIVQWNCRSLRSSFPQFEERSQNIGVIIISETWHDEREIVYLKVFDVVRKERNERVGGIVATL
jgi:hypothetical protein